MRQDRWNTYATYGYSYDVANDQRSAGGVHNWQVKRGKSGWLFRIEQANGVHRSYGEVTPMTEQQGEAAWETAKQKAAA